MLLTVALLAVFIYLHVLLQKELGQEQSAVGGDVVLPILGTVPGYVGGAILGGIGALQTEVGI